MFNRKRIEELQKTVNELKEIVVTQELTRLRNINKDYKEQCELLSHIHLELKNVRTVERDDGSYYLEVSYKTPVVHISFNEEGKLVRNDFFRSVNMLNLLSQEDTERIAKEISAAERKIKKV